MVSLLLTLLKFLSIVATAFFGIAGLLHDFKDNNNRITKWGRISLAGIVLSGVIAGATEIAVIFKSRAQEIVETSRQKEVLDRIDRTTAQSKNILQETTRVLHPIEDLHVSFTAELPIDAPELKGFRDRLRREAETFIKLPLDQQRDSTNNLRTVGWEGTIGKDPAVPMMLEVFSDNQAFNSVSDGNARRLLSDAGVKIEFYNPPIPPGSYPATGGIGQPSRGAGLSLCITRSLPLLRSEDQKACSLYFDLKRNVLYYGAYDLAVPEQLLHSTGQLVSIPDLLGGQVFARFYTGTELQLGGKSGVFNDVKLTFIGLSFKGARGFSFGEKELMRCSNKSGVSYYSTKLPLELSALLNHK